MIVYFYDNEGYFSGKRLAQKHPFKNEYLLPLNSTMLAPPQDYSINEEPVFNGNSWDLTTSRAKLAEENELTTQEDALLEKVNSYGVKEYFRNDLGRVVLRPQEEIDAENQVIIDDINATNRKIALDNVIIEEAKRVTRAGDKDSAQAFVQAYQLRMTYPADYVSKNLMVFFAIGQYALYEPLDTIEKIADYYKQVLIYLDDFREEEIRKYITANQ